MPALTKVLHSQLFNCSLPPLSQEHQQQRRQLDSGVYEQQIQVVSDLVGLAIGRDGHNVNEVRKLDGILSVEFEDYNQMFRVRAKVGYVRSDTGCKIWRSHQIFYSSCTKMYNLDAKVTQF